MVKHIIAGLVGTLVLGTAAWAEETAQVANLNDYLVDSSGTFVGAAGIIGLDSKLVRDAGTPKSFVASVNAAKGKESKDGGGIAFSPGRSIFDLTSIDVSRAAYNDKRDWLLSHRLWGSTTFSYAQNRTTIGSADYKQHAYAANVEYYLNVDDDPAVAAYRYVAEGKGACKTALAARKKAAEKAGTLDPVPNLVKEQEQATAKARALRAMATTSEVDALVAAPTATATQAASTAAVARGLAIKAESDSNDITTCAQEATKEAKAKWNASKVTFLIGQGWIQGTGAADPKLKLGRFLQLGFAFSPPDMIADRVGMNAKQTQFTLSLNRALDVLDTATVAGDPVYKSKSLVAARYTRGWDEGLTSYLLAEVSNAKAKDGAVARGAYKWALGADLKLGNNAWLEIRSGRSVSSTGDKTEIKTLASVKMAFEPTLASLIQKR